MQKCTVFLLSPLTHHFNLKKCLLKNFSPPY